jgi:UDP-N-acetylglucosamine 2-epimerase (non-hydrolysing)
MSRILVIVGARPNFVKAAPLLAEIRRYPELEPVLVHTGQHYDYRMSQAFFEDLDIPEPDVNLAAGSGTAVGQLADMMLRLERVIEEVEPEVVIVFGDVNSTLAGALAAKKMGKPVAHVEAGLRSFDRSMPEELNRILADAVSDLLFVTEPSGVENLLKEGRSRHNVFLVGNVVIDALRRFLSQARQCALPPELRRGGAYPAEWPGGYALSTLHRAATVDDPATLRAVWEGLKRIAEEIPLVFPVHPRTQAGLRKAGVAFPAEPATGILLVPPLSYLQFLRLQSEARMVVTDSGGVQEETTALEIPCLTVRENTERPITLSEGTNVLVGLSAGRLLDEAQRILRGKGKHGQVPRLWDGQASARIVQILLEYLQTSSYGYHHNGLVHAV